MKSTLLNSFAGTVAAVALSVSASVAEAGDKYGIPGFDEVSQTVQQAMPKNTRGTTGQPMHLAQQEFKRAAPASAPQQQRAGYGNGNGHDMAAYYKILRDDQYKQAYNVGQGRDLFHIYASNGSTAVKFIYEPRTPEEAASPVIEAHRFVGSYDLTDPKESRRYEKDMGTSFSAQSKAEAADAKAANRAAKAAEREEAREDKRDRRQTQQVMKACTSGKGNRCEAEVLESVLDLGF